MLNSDWSMNERFLVKIFLECCPIIKYVCTFNKDTLENNLILGYPKLQEQGGTTGVCKTRVPGK